MTSAPHVEREVVLAPRLRAGDRVRLVSPASYPSREWLAESVRILREWDLIVEVGEHVLDERGYMAGRDEDRLSDLNDAFRDPGVRAVITTRGGAGAYRLPDGIDFDAVRADPKPVHGFSDITNLHLALWQQCRVPGVHGCLAGERAIATSRQLLMTTESVTLHRDPAAPLAVVEVQGKATGFLMGGNLTTIVGFIAAGLPSLDGAILCVEDNGCANDAARLDSYLYQLLASGSLDGLRGVAIGDLAGLNATVPDWQAVVDVCQERLCSLGVPVLAGLPFGHIPNQSCLPLGTIATIDTAAGTITAAPAVI